MKGREFTPAKRILIIVSDDQGAWAMAGAGTPELHTPNLDRLASWGKRFESLYCVSPVCSPARASILTGRIPSAHGVHDWIRAGNATIEREYHRELIDYMDRFPTFVELMAMSGFRCGLSGKWHLGNSHRPHRGFEFWRPFATGSGHYMDPTMIRSGNVAVEKGYVTDIITDNALTFLERCADDQRWYLGVHYTAPHSPWDLDQHPAEDVALYYPGCAFPSLPQHEMHPDFFDPTQFPADRESRLRVLSGYAAAVSAMDRNIGRLLQYLDDRNALDDTLIVFTSDNGMNMGHHGIYGKGNGTDPINLYETSVKVPGMVAWKCRTVPGLLKGVYSHYDLFPTLMTLAGIPERVPRGLPGRNISEILFAREPDEDGYAVVFDEYGPNRMIRHGRWKLVHRCGRGVRELYDLANDPQETRNLNGDPMFRDIRLELENTLATWFERYSIPGFEGMSTKVRGGGQIDRIDRPRTHLFPFVLHDGRSADMQVGPY